MNVEAWFKEVTRLIRVLGNPGSVEVIITRKEDHPNSMALWVVNCTGFPGSNGSTKEKAMLQTLVGLRAKLKSTIDARARELANLQTIENVAALRALDEPVEIEDD